MTLIGDTRLETRDDTGDLIGLSDSKVATPTLWLLMAAHKRWGLPTKSIGAVSL